jgi:3-hydroxy-9,10-secoandrosta-1,3,5(10)-triene-9,17-dione monooxygenase
MIENGFYRILQPRLFGGYEFDLRTYVETIMELSRGDSAVGWVVGFNAGHAFQAAQLPLAGQIEVFGQDGDFRAPMVSTPFGEAFETPDGYVISGRWNYTSGGEVSNWLGVFVKVPSGSDESAPPDIRVCFIRDTDYHIVDNWHVLGMRGTGSKQAVVENVFVPKERTFSWSKLIEKCEAPGHGVHTNPFYQTPTQPILGTEVSAVIVGVAHAAIDAFIEYAENKQSPFPPFPRLKEERRTHDALGRALAKLEAAKACLYTLADRQMKRCDRVNTDEKFTDEEILMDVVLVQQIAALSIETVNIVYDAAGSSGAREGNLLERVFRDASMIRTHYYLDHSRTAENLGALRLGFKRESYL